MSKKSLFALITILFASLGIATRVAYMKPSAFPFLNSPPIANADNYTVHGNTLIGSMLANDSDPDGDSISFYSVITGPSHGTLSPTGNPAYQFYNPQTGYSGTDSFTYRIRDSFSNLSNTATVTLNVVSNPPTATADSYTVHGSTLIGSFLANDLDLDGDSFTFYDIVTTPTHGTLWTVTNPTYRTYIPQLGYVGTDSFTYRIRDSLGNISSPGTVTLNVVNNPPAANADVYIAYTGTNTLMAPKENDFDLDGDSIGSILVTVSPTNGTLNVTGNPDIKSYVPNAGFTGTDTWQYRITDSLGQSSDATVYVLVLPNPLLPKAPYACCPSDPGSLADFNPESGGNAHTSGGPAGSSGPSWPDPVNLATGRETFAPPPDLQVYNPTGPSVFW
ncbi:MAG TPA: Ig-like domain-containing protein, partial [Pyrinomonadaceae bacterium]